MEEEEINNENEDAQLPEEGGGGKNLRSIERSGLRGAQGKPGVRKRRVVKTRQKRGTSESAQERPRRKQQKSNAGKKAAIFFTLVAIIVLFLLTTVFATARLDLTLPHVEVSVDGVFHAIRKPAQSKDISYQRLGAFNATEEELITNGTQELRNTRAKGTAVLYNANPSGESLPLINRTRLQSESGSIYRLVGKHVIPGGKTVGGKFVSGSKEVKIEADDFGDNFNLPDKGVRLSVPTLIEKYPTFADTYAVTSSKVVGGFSGPRFIPDADEEVKVRQQLRRDAEKNLRAQLVQSVTNNSLSEQMVFEEGVFIEFEPGEEQIGDDAMMIREKGTLHAIAFREADLAALLAKYVPSSIQSVLPTRIEGASLSMNIEENNEFNIVSSTEFSFRLAGLANLYWDIDTALLTSDIIGKNRKEVADILTNEYPQVIQHETPSIFPAWRNALPANKKKITIEIEYAPYNG